MVKAWSGPDLRFNRNNITVSAGPGSNYLFNTSNARPSNGGTLSATITAHIINKVDRNHPQRARRGRANACWTEAARRGMQASNTDQHLCTPIRYHHP